MTKKLSAIQKDFRQALKADRFAKQVERQKRAQLKVRQLAQGQRQVDRLSPSQIPDFLASASALSKTVLSALKPPKLKLADKMKAVKNFTNFSFKNIKRISPKNKAKISKAFKQFWAMKSQGFEFSKQRSAKKKETIKSFYKGDYDLKLFKGAFFPNPLQGTKAKIKFIGKGAKNFKIKIAKNGQIPARSIIPIDHIKLAKFGEAYINKLIKTKSKKRRFAPVTRSVGALTKYGYQQSGEYIGALISEWAQEYSDAGEWLDGIIEIEGE